MIFSSLGNVIILSFASLIIFLFLKAKSRMTAMTILSLIFSLIGLSLWVYTRFYQSPFLSRDLTFAKNAESEMGIFFCLSYSFVFICIMAELYCLLISFVLLIVQITFTRINKKEHVVIYGRMSKSKGWLKSLYTSFGNNIIKCFCFVILNLDITMLNPNGN